MVTAGSALWPVEPKQRVGPFVLGMGVNEALGVVQKMGSLDRAELSFDENRPFDTDLSLRMPSLGLQLCFDGLQQDLRVIAVCLRHRGAKEGEEPSGEGAGAPPAMQPPLSYGGRVFVGAQQPVLCLRDVYAMFGPTYIGDFESEGDAAYFLRYPGITFEFPLPEDMVVALASRGEHPMELPGRPPPTAIRMWVFAEDSSSFAAPASALPDLPETVIVRPATGVELRGRVLRFGAMPQDVFSDFGPPEQVCVKDVDAVRIHSARGVPSRAAGPDYYYNYFHLGLDVLFDGCTHLVKKVVLHTNPPTHELFSRYTRCFFQILIEAPSGWDPGVGSGAAAAAEAPAAAPAAADEETSLPPLPPAARSDAPLEGRRGGGRGLEREEEPPPLWAPKKPRPARPGAESSEARGEPREAEAEREEPPAMVPKAPRTLRGEAESPEAKGEPKEAEAEREDGCEGGAAGEDEDDGQEPFQLAGRKMSKKERKAARKNRKNTGRTPVGSPALQTESSPVLTIPSTSPEPSPLLSVLDSEDRGSEEDGFVKRKPRRGRRGDASPGDSAPGAGEPLDSDALCFDELLPPPALPLDGDGLDAVDAAVLEASPRACASSGSGRIVDVAQGSASGARGNSSGWGSELDVLELDIASQVPAAPAALDGGAPETYCIDVRWPWPKIQELLGGRAGVNCGKPLLIVSQSGHTPFGSTSFYAFPGVAFEVMQNGWLASLTVFSVPREELPSAFLPQPQKGLQAASEAGAQR